MTIDSREQPSRLPIIPADSQIILLPERAASAIVSPFS